jgi:hypothetical protein
MAASCRALIPCLKEEAAIARVVAPFVNSFDRRQPFPPDIFAAVWGDNFLNPP